MSVDFHYAPTSGDLSGASFEAQTARAFNELGAEIDDSNTMAREAAAIAGAAQATAVDALSTSQIANNIAQNAEATALEALGEAQKAQSAAGEAHERANEAYDLAADAQSAADGAQGRADSAYELASEEIPVASPAQKGLAPSGGEPGQTYKVSADGSTYGWESPEADPALPSVSGFVHEPGYNVEATRYIVGRYPAGEFAGAAPNSFAEYKNGRWSFKNPEHGQETWDVSAGQLLQYNAEIDSWQNRLIAGAPTMGTAWLVADEEKEGQSAWTLNGQFYEKILDIPGMSVSHFVFAEISPETDRNLRARLYVYAAPNSIVFKTAEKPTGDLFATFLLTRTREGL